MRAGDACGWRRRSASGCPFCLIMLEEGVGAKGVQDVIKPVDVLELVAGRLES